MGIIDFGEAEKPIKEIEGILEPMNQEEKLLVLKLVGQRLTRKMEQQKISDNLQNIPMGGLIKKFMKDQDKEEGEQS